MDKKDITIFVLVLIILGGVIGFYVLNQEKSIKTFDVKYNSKYSSSGGDRVLDIIYSVQDGVITSCEGSYTFSGTDGNQTEACDLNKLKNKQSPFVVEKLLTEFSKGEETKGEVRDGPLTYNWEIIVK